MKEKYVGPAYGLGNWSKTDVFTRNVYNFNGSKSWAGKTIEFVVWSGTFIALVTVAAGFLWLLGG